MCVWLCACSCVSVCMCACVSVYGHTSKCVASCFCDDIQQSKINIQEITSYFNVSHAHPQNDHTLPKVASSILFKENATTPANVGFKWREPNRFLGKITWFHTQRQSPWFSVTEAEFTLPGDEAAASQPAMRASHRCIGSVFASPQPLPEWSERATAAPIQTRWGDATARRNNISLFSVSVPKILHLALQLTTRIWVRRCRMLKRRSSKLPPKKHFASMLLHLLCELKGFSYW